jgi:hypothetical protein
MNYVSPDLQANEAVRIRFDLTLSELLGYNKVATVICIQTENSSYTMNDGDTKSAFGVSFECTISGGCSNSLHLGASFYGATATYSGSAYTWINSNLDLSTSNKGNEAGDGLTVKTTYGMDASWADWANIPLENVSSYLKCFASYNVDPSTASLNTQRDITNWVNSNESFLITTSEVNCLNGS